MVDSRSLGNDAFNALAKATAIVGPIDVSARGSIQGAVNRLQRELRYFDRHAQEVSRGEAPDDLETYVKNKYNTGKGYTDKRYKMMFLKTLYYPVKKIQDRMDLGHRLHMQSSMRSLTNFKLLMNVLLSTSNQLIERAGGLQEKVEDLDPEDYDPEQSGITQELERELPPSSATDSHQKQTKTNIDRKMRRKPPTGKAESEDEYRRMVAKYSQVVENARSVVDKNAGRLKRDLQRSDAETFRLILNATKKANDLAKAYNAAGSSARSALVPGSYSACTAFASFISTLTRVVIDASAGNRSNRALFKKREQDYQEYLKTVQSRDPNGN